MKNYIRFICLFLVMAPLAMQGMNDTLSFSQRTNNGPVTPKEAKSVRYEMFSHGMEITAILDSTAPTQKLFMKMFISKYAGVGTYALNANTKYKYGNRSDQEYTCYEGQFIVTNVDSVTNVVSATFWWLGNATLQTGETLRIRIDPGNTMIAVKPKLVMYPNPGDGVKLKQKEEHKVKIYAQKGSIQNVFVPGTKITLSHNGVVFQGPKSVEGITDATGSATFTLKMKDEVAEGEYTFDVKGEREAYFESDVLPVKFSVVPNNRYYYTKCNGISGFEFDAGVDEKWEDAGGTSVISSGNNIQLMGMLLIKGSVTIDTVGGGAQVSGNGDVYFNGVSFGGAVQPFLLRQGSFFFVAPSCGKIIDLASAAIVSKLTGGAIKEAKLEFLGTGTKATGAKITGAYEFSKSEEGGCRADLPFGTIWAPGPAPKLTLELGFVSNESTTEFIVGGTVNDFTMGSSWCIKELKVLYDGPKDEISVSGKVKSPFFSEAGGGIKFKNGTLNALNADFTLEKCIPVPNIPGVCWRGGGFAIENLFIGNPFKGSVKAVFGPYDPLKDLYELEFNCGVEDPPTKVSGGVTGKLLKLEALSKTKPFQAELSGTGSFEPAAFKVGLKVTGSALHLGGDYFYTGGYEGSIGLNPMVVTLKIDGSLTFPKLGDDQAAKIGVLGKFINAYAPVPLGVVGGSLILHAEGDRIGTINYDFSGAVLGAQFDPKFAATLRALGKGTLTVDFNRLPSPAAFTVDGGFSTLLSGLFSAGPKDNGQVQAAEKIFEVMAGQERLIVTIASENAGVLSSLTDPSNRVYEDEDTANGVFKAITPNGKITLWVVKNPAAGMWKLASPNATATDSITVQTSAPKPALVMHAVVVGDKLRIEWNSTDLPSDASILLYVDDDNEGFDGIYVDSVGVGVQFVEIPLVDSIAPCKFNVYGVLQSTKLSLMEYAPDQLSNTSFSLKAPTGLSAVSNQSGSTTISWNPITDPQVASIGVFLNGTDELLAAAKSTETSTTVQIENHEAKMLRVVAMTMMGRRSCESEALTIVTGVEEDRWVVIRSGAELYMAVSPNPAFDLVKIKIDAPREMSGRLFISDANGNLVYVQSMNALAPTETIEYNTAKLSTGVYRVVYVAGNSTVSQPLVIIK